MSRKAKFRPGPIEGVVSEAGEDIVHKNQILAQNILKQNHDFAQAFGVIVKKVNSPASANMVLMGYELWRNDPSIKFRAKPVGIANGFVAVGECDFFVKSFLGGSTSGRSQLVELFAYKLLEKLGLGAEIQGRVYEGIVPFLASRDLRVGGNSVCFGDGAKKVLSPVFKDEEGSVETKASVIALEILAKILQLGDLSQNEGNYGVVISDDGRVVKPVAVDFHFDPHLSTVLSKGGSNIRLDGFRQDLLHARRASETMAVGLTKAAAGSEISEEVYSKALELISAENMQVAIEESLEYCQEFVAQIRDGELLSEDFKISDVEDYITEVENNFAKLREDAVKRKSSSAAILDLLVSGRASGVYLELIGEEGTPLSTSSDMSGLFISIQPQLQSQAPAPEIEIVAGSSSVRASNVLGNCSGDKGNCSIS